MKIRSKILGEVEIEESTIINFPAGIPAFEEEKEFAVIPLNEVGHFYYLQSVNRADLCLITADPFAFFPDYQVEVSDQELQVIQADEEGKNISILTVLTIPEDFKRTTANLFAPLIIDTKSRYGMQIIPEKSNYSLKHLIFPQEEKMQAAVGQGE